MTFTTNKPLNYDRAISTVVLTKRAERQACILLSKHIINHLMHHLMLVIVELLMAVPNLQCVNY